MSRSRVLRQVSCRRARVLRQRGERVYWHRKLSSFVWEWHGHGCRA